MDRSFSRFATLGGAVAVVGMLLAGCSSGQPGGAVLGVPASATAPPAVATGDVLTGLERAIAAELAAVNATQSDPEPGQVLIELEALDSVSSLARAEAFTSLQDTGTKEIATREHLVDGLASDVENDAYLKGVQLSGASLRGSLMSILMGVNGRLQDLAAKIAADALPDVLRADVISVNSSTRVYGVVEPMVHLALAGGDELSEVNAFASQYQRDANAIAAGAATDPNYSRELALLNNLSGRIATARQTAGSATTAVLRLTPAEFPGTKTVITNARTQLTDLRASGGALAVAASDVAQITALLGDR